VYSIYSVKDTFKMPPEYFGEDIEKVAASILQTKYEGRIDKDIGVVVAIFNVRNIGDGLIYPGDPSTHHDAEFDILSFMPQVEEVVAGQVTELVEFGAFVRIGPMDGLVHVSQIAGDFLTFDKKNMAFVSKRSSISLKKADVVYAKVSTVSMKNTIKDSKIALTMKPDGLGRPEWANLQNAKARARKGGSARRK
jgi:DNA-directed RNA polymerase subunit E'